MVVKVLEVGTHGFFKITKSERVGYKITYEVSVPKDYITALIDRKIEEIGATYNLPGFRTGMVPENLLRVKYEAAIRSQALEYATSGVEHILLGNLGYTFGHSTEVLDAYENLEILIMAQAIPPMSLQGSTKWLRNSTAMGAYLFPLMGERQTKMIRDLATGMLNEMNARMEQARKAGPTVEL